LQRRVPWTDPTCHSSRQPPVIVRRLLRGLVAAGLAMLCATGGVLGLERWLAQQVRHAQPTLPIVDISSIFTDATPLAATITVGGQRLPWSTTVDDLRLNLSLWRSMHHYPWNDIPQPLRQ